MAGETVTACVGTSSGLSAGRSIHALHNRSGGSADNIDRTHTANLSSEPYNGTRKLRVNDNVANDTGRIDAWSITF